MPGSGYPPSASAGSRFVLKQDTAGQTTLTSGTVSTPNSGTGYGSWVQVTASSAAEYYVTSVSLTPQGSGTSLGITDGPYLVQVGRGGAGSETTLATVPCGVMDSNGSAYTWSGSEPLVAPLRISSGSRIAVRISRVASGTTSAQTFYVTLALVPYLNVEGN